MKKDVNSMNIAPVPIKSACLRMMGMAMLPTADAPVKNLAASIHLHGKQSQNLNQMTKKEEHEITPKPIFILSHKPSKTYVLINVHRKVWKASCQRTPDTSTG